MYDLDDVKRILCSILDVFAAVIASAPALAATSVALTGITAAGTTPFFCSLLSFGSNRSAKSTGYIGNISPRIVRESKSLYGKIASVLAAGSCLRRPTLLVTPNFQMERLHSPRRSQNVFRKDKRIASEDH